jgi:hypothetical protein
MKLSAVTEHRSYTALIYIAAQSLLTEFEEGKLMKQRHAAPSKLHRIIE